MCIARTRALEDLLLKRTTASHEQPPLRNASYWINLKEKFNISSTTRAFVCNPGIAETLFMVGLLKISFIRKIKIVIRPFFLVLSSVILILERKSLNAVSVRPVRFDFKFFLADFARKMGFLRREWQTLVAPTFWQTFLFSFKEIQFSMLHLTYRILSPSYPTWISVKQEWIRAKNK